MKASIAIGLVVGSVVWFGSIVVMGIGFGSHDGFGIGDNGFGGTAIGIGAVALFIITTLCMIDMIYWAFPSKHPDNGQARVRHPPPVMVADDAVVHPPPVMVAAVHPPVMVVGDAAVHPPLMVAGDPDHIDLN